MVNKTIREALEYVANHPEPMVEPLDMPVWEHVARALFDIANNPDPKVRGAMARATRAQQIILDRRVGRRRAGTRPKVEERQQIEFRDLTDGVVKM